MIDLHTHSLFSDGELIPAELVRRFEAAGYQAIAITDHADESNLELIVPRIRSFCEEINTRGGIELVPGIELTHIHPEAIPKLIATSRQLGARIVVVHGETIVEPVAKGTNRAAIDACADILAHPGLITEDEVFAAKQKGVYLEITSRKGHSLTNGHVARLAKKAGAKLILNSDAHAPTDIWPREQLAGLVIGAGLDIDDFAQMIENARGLIARCQSSKR